jgi:hypothetical protein
MITEIAETKASRPLAPNPTIDHDREFSISYLPQGVPSAISRKGFSIRIMFALCFVTNLPQAKPK